MQPEKFSALAMLPYGDGREAAKELERCVVKYRFVGGVLGFRRSGERGEGGWKGWDGREWEEVWKCAERFGVPLALRPMFVTVEEVGVVLNETAKLLNFVSEKANWTDCANTGVCIQRPGRWPDIP